MRKRNIQFLLDKLLYFSFLAVPVLVCLVLAINSPYSSIGDYLSSMSGIMSNTIVYNPINDCIGVGGIVPFVNEKTAFLVDWLAWAVTVSVLHLLLDAFLFFPQIIRSGLSKISVTDDND